MPPWCSTAKCIARSPSLGNCRFCGHSSQSGEFATYVVATVEVSVATMHVVTSRVLTKALLRVYVHVNKRVPTSQKRDIFKCLPDIKVLWICSRSKERKAEGLDIDQAIMHLYACEFCYILSIWNENSVNSPLITLIFLMYIYVRRNPVNLTIRLAHICNSELLILN